jgi:IclR family transcriptional regulator, pca regulon regulatory protein
MNETRVSPGAACSLAVQPKDLVEGLAKGLRVIEAFDDEHPTLTATQCAQRCGVTRTAARRHLLTLVHLGYAASDGKRFWLAPRVLRLGGSFLDAARLPRLVQPLLQQLSQATQETVNLSVLDGHEVTYLARSNSPRVLSVGYQRGARAPAHTVAPGPLLAGMLDDAGLEAWVRQHEFKRYTPQTITDAAVFVQHARAARAAGYVVWEQQLNAGYTGVAVPLVDRRGHCHGAIGMAVSSANWTRAQIEARLLPTLQGAAKNARTVL